VLPRSQIRSVWRWLSGTAPHFGSRRLRKVTRVTACYTPKIFQSLPQLHRVQRRLIQVGNNATGVKSGLPSICIKKQWQLGNKHDKKETKIAVRNVLSQQSYSIMCWKWSASAMRCPQTTWCTWLQLLPKITFTYRIDFLLLRLFSVVYCAETREKPPSTNALLTGK